MRHFVQFIVLHGYISSRLFCGASNRDVSDSRRLTASLIASRELRAVVASADACFNHICQNAVMCFCMAVRAFEVCPEQIASTILR